jgi:tetratricopeptide (TPR) repeat protein
MDSRQRYKAFISYSHRDRKAAQWLHRALETYRPPRLLSKGGVGLSGASLRPIFRDRDELSASLDLNGAIRTALEQSDALIVLCSEASAASRWVDQEVEYFLRGAPPERIICVITPEVGANTDLAAILPPSLRAALPPGLEPLAVDLRRDGDGRRLARLKIAARLLGVSLDQLVQRDARRRLQVMAAFTTAAVVLAIVMAAMTVMTLKSRQIARQQRDETEALVAFMLGDLRQQLEPVGRLDVLDSVSAKVLAYYAKAQTDRLDDKALGQRAKAQTLLGTIREQRGDLAGAEHAFSQAAATTHTLVERNPQNGDYVFDEAQNVYWLAYMQWRRDEVAGAERGFRRYGELADRLVALDPSRSDWRIEVAYAQNNLGALFYEQGRPADALAAFRVASTVFKTQLVQSPDDQALRQGLANSRAWAADCLLRMGRPREALADREASVSLFEDALAARPNDKPLVAKAVGAQLALARLELDIGRPDSASERLEDSLKRLRSLAALDPTNARWREYLATGLMDAADVALWSGRPALAEAVHAEAAKIVNDRREGAKVEPWSDKLDGRLYQQAVTLARQAGRSEKARLLAETLSAQMKTVDWRKDIGSAGLYGGAEWAAGRPASAVDILWPRRATLSPGAKDFLARSLAAVGRKSDADAIVRDLTKQGYAHPGFLAFWRDSLSGGASTREAQK